MQHKSLPFGKQLAYSFGMIGWSVMVNLISVILIYLYLPPVGKGLPNLIGLSKSFNVWSA